MKHRDRPLATFTLPPDVTDRLRAYSDATGVPMSRLVEEALRRHLEAVAAVLRVAA